MPLLTAEQANTFYKSLVINCLNNTSSLRDIDIALYVHPDISHPFIKKLCLDYPVTLHQQQGKNLGERMHHALDQSLKKYKHSILIGTDCPQLDATYINEAFNSLQQHDIVIGPAEDGGYVLIGARKIESGLFSNISWSTEFVLQQSLKNIESSRYSSRLLNALGDIDTPDDYLQYQLHQKTISN